MACLFSFPAFAAPPHPDLVRDIREGRRPEPDYLRELREKGPHKVRGERQAGKILRELKRRQDESLGITTLPAPGTEPLSVTEPAVSAAPPAMGTVNALALLASFADVAPWQDATYFDRLVFGFDGTTFGALSPSLSHYYRDVSGDKFVVQSLVSDLPSDLGWLPLKSKATYLADLRTMLEDTVLAVDGAVDFSQYDQDGDGFVDYLILVHAGSGQEYTGDPNDFWSQTATVAPVSTADGVSIDTFTIVPEYWVPSNAGRMTIGVYVHEFGHLLGLPDLYDYGFDSKGIGDWGLMGLGMWNGPTVLGASPSWPSAYSRVALGWVDPQIPIVDVPLATLPPVEREGAGRGGPVYYLWNNGAASSEFFLIENRQQLGYDAYLPGHGLLVWHVDEAMPDNNTQILTVDPVLKHADCGWPSHYRVALQQADGYMNLEANLNDGDPSDPYPGYGGKTEFSPTSTPNSGSYRNCTSGVAVRYITEIDGDIQVGLEVNSPPELAVDSHIALSPVAPFRELPVAVALSNQGAEATGVSAVLVSRDPLVVVTKAAAVFPDIVRGGGAANDADPFLLTLDPLVMAGKAIPMELQLTADGGYNAVLPFTMTAGSLRWGASRPGSPRASGL